MAVKCSNVPGTLVLADRGGQARRPASGDRLTLGRDWALAWQGRCLVERQWSQDRVIPEASRSSVCGTERQAAVVKNQLKRIQYWPRLIKGPSPRPDSPRT
jgi:hypothetical protein